MSDHPNPKTPAPSIPRRIGRAALWLGGSAVFGSVALVLWNRKVLRSMREAADSPPDPIRFRDDDGIY